MTQHIAGFFVLESAIPSAAPRACRYLNCPALAYAGMYCKEHAPDESLRKRIFDSTRESSAKRGYGRKWREARQVFLIANPLCAEHWSRREVVEATVVDHIIPHKGNLKLFWNRRNWQALCATCHSIKTVREDGGFGNEVGSWARG